MINTGSASSKPILFLSQDVVVFQVTLQPSVQYVRVYLGHAADNRYTAVLERISRVFIFFRHRNYVAKIPVSWILARAKTKVEKLEKEHFGIWVFDSFIGDFKVCLLELTFVDSN